MSKPSLQDIKAAVSTALAEDIQSGDISAALIPEESRGRARIISRESGIICGRPWVDEVFSQLDPAVKLEWQVADGDRVSANSTLLYLQGPTRSLLTGERTALNFLQLLSGTASRCDHYAALVAGTGVKLLDTRKTVPGLRTAQKYAVSCGGCYNHRIGLYDAYLIKENHILACGSITAAVATARNNAPDKLVEVEVESLPELKEAITSRCDRIMLDNFSLAELSEAVDICQGRIALEASGGVSESSLRPIAETGVDYISIGALTKDVVALDLSMRLLDTPTDS